MKERLTGAIILVALMVLLVPELLTGPVGTKSAPASAASSSADPIARPAHAQPPLRTYTLTLAPAAPAHETVAVAAAQVQPAQVQPAQVQPAQSAQQSAAPAPGESSAGMSEAPVPPRESTRAAARGLQAAKPPAHPVRETGSSASSRGWVVQLGSFADRQNAVRLARTLEARGFRMSVSPARARSRVLWRVRAGPARDRAGAQRLAARLRSLGHRGELLPVR